VGQAEPLIPADGAGTSAFCGLKSFSPAALLNLTVGRQTTLDR